MNYILILQGIDKSYTNRENESVIHSVIHSYWRRADIGDCSIKQEQNENKIYLQLYSPSCLFHGLAYITHNSEAQHAGRHGYDG